MIRIYLREIIYITWLQSVVDQQLNIQESFELFSPAIAQIL